MEELTKNGEQMEWKETARWIKFEENVEDSNRWGRPHVASLTFHSLLELKKGLEKGAVTSSTLLYLSVCTHGVIGQFCGPYVTVQPAKLQLVSFPAQLINLRDPSEI